jgi:CPA1 family monovalent cation:H+ antiporter
MSLFDIIAMLMTLAALFGYINHRWLKLEPTVGLLMISLASSLGIMGLHWLFPRLEIVNEIQRVVGGIDFNEALMHGMLGFLLFAGALHVDLEYFIRRKGTIAALATIGLLTSTFLVAGLSWLLFNWLGLEISFLACLVFGALISPTDPIAVMGTLKTLNAPKDLEANIAGESLFNDGVAVVVFTGLVALLQAQTGHGGGGHAGHGGEFGTSQLGIFFLREAGGGAILGLIAGYVAYRMMLSIDDYRVEVMLTLALVMGAYSLAWALHVSGPIAVVVAGIMIGNRGRALAMSEEVADYLEKFWELIDEILNAMLFMLIGVEVLVISFSGRSLLAGAIVIFIVLLARFVSVAIPISVIKLRSEFPRGVVRILTWAGLRGGISVALALSLPPSPAKNIILSSTYMVVLFSILVQGMTIKKVLRRYLDPVPEVEEEG